MVGSRYVVTRLMGHGMWEEGKGEEQGGRRNGGRYRVCMGKMDGVWKEY